MEILGRQSSATVNTRDFSPARSGAFRGRIALRRPDNFNAWMPPRHSLILKKYYQSVRYIEERAAPAIPRYLRLVDRKPPRHYVNLQYSN